MNRLFGTGLLLLTLIAGAARGADLSLAQKLQHGVFPKGLVRDQRFDVNDVSYLWPQFDENSLRMIDPQDPSRDLIPSREAFKAYQRFMDKSSSEGALMNPVTGQPEVVVTDTDSFLSAQLEDYRVVSFRVDDCGPSSRNHRGGPQKIWQLQDGVKKLVSVRTGCVPQLRLIVEAEDKPDLALHLIYSFVESPETFEADFKANRHRADEKILQAMMQDLLFLKSLSGVSTDGKPLGVHPGLAADGDSSFRAKVIQFLRFYARKTYLTEIALLSTNDFDGGSPWAFASFAVRATEPDRVAANPNLSMKDNDLSIGFTTDQLEMRANLKPQVFVRQENALLNSQTATVDQILSQMDPRQGSVQNRDCVSCHSESRVLSTLAGTRPSILNALAAHAVSVPVFAGITGFADPNVLPWTMDGQQENIFRAFGLFDGRPVATQRTAFESATVAASMNDRLFGSEKGDGLTCDRAPMQLLACLFRNNHRPNSCFKSFCE